MHSIRNALSKVQFVQKTNYDRIKKELVDLRASTGKEIARLQSESTFNANRVNCLQRELNNLKVTSDDHGKKLQVQQLSSASQNQEINSLRETLSASEEKSALKDTVILSLQNSIVSLQNSMDICTRTTERVQNEQDSYRLTSSTKIANLQEKIRLLQTDATKNKEEINLMQADLTQKTEKIRSLKNDVSSMQQEASKKTEQIQSMLADLTNKTEQIRSLNADATQKTEQICSLKDDATQKTEKIHSMQADLTKKTEQIRSLKTEASKKTEQIRSLKTDISSMQQDASKKTEQIHLMQADLTKKTEQIRSLKTDATQKTDQIHSMQVDLTKKTEQILSLKTDSTQMVTSLKLDASQITLLQQQVTSVKLQLDQQGTDLQETRFRLLRVERVASFTLNRETTKLWDHTKMHHFGQFIYNDLRLSGELWARKKRWGNIPAEFHQDFKRALIMPNSTTLHETQRVENRIRNSRAATVSNNSRHPNITLKQLNKSASSCKQICNSKIHTNGMPFNLQYSNEANDFMRFSLSQDEYDDMALIIGLLSENIPQRPANKP